MSRTHWAIGLVLAAGVVVLVIGWERFTHDNAPVVQAPNSPPAAVLPSIPTDDGALASGRVFDELGSTDSFATVTADVPGKDPFDKTQPALHAGVAADGSFRIVGVLDAPRIELQAHRYGSSGTSIVVDRGARGVRLELPPCGSLSLRLLGPGEPTIVDFGLSLSRSEPEPFYGGVTIRPEGAGERSTVAFEKLGADVSGYGIRFPCLPQGEYTLDISLSEQIKPLLSIGGIHVSDGEEVRDPRLKSIDLRQLVHAHSLEFFDSERKPVDAGTVEFADPLSPLMRFRHPFAHAALRFLSRSAALDVTVRAPGFLVAKARITETPQKVELRRGVPLHVRVSGVVLPTPPSRVRIACVPLDDDPLTIAKVGPMWLASREVFDDPEAMDGISRVAHAHFFDASDVEPDGVAKLTAASTGEHVLRAYLFSESEGSDQIGIAEIPLDPLPHVMIVGGADAQVVPLVIDPKWIEQIQFPK